MTRFNAIYQIKSYFLLFLSLYFIIFSSAAIEIKNEDQICQRYQTIRNDMSMSYQKKDKLFIALLKQAEPLKNQMCNALIINQLQYSSISQMDKVSAQKWLVQYSRTVDMISSKPSSEALNLLAKKNQMFSLQKEHQHLPALKISLALFSQIKSLTIQKNESLFNGEIYLTQLDIADINNLTGISYFLIGDYDHAQQYFLASLNIHEELNHLKGISRALNNLSLISWAQKDFHAALKYLERPLQISRQLGNSEYQILNTSNQGIYYTELKQFDNAITSFKKAINHPESGTFPDATLGAMIGLAEVYILVNKLTAAEALLKNVLTLSIATNNKKSQVSGEIFIGHISMLQGRYEEALNTFNRAIIYYKERQLQRQVADTYKRISDTYQAQQEWQLAFSFYEKHTLLINKLNDDAQQKSVNVLHAQYKAEVKQKQITLLQAENQLKTLEIKSTKSKGIITIVITLSALAILLLSINRYHIRKEKVRLIRHNKTIKANEKQLMLMSNAFKNTSDAMWITNEKFEIIVVNNAYVTHTHRHKSEVIGLKVAFALTNSQPEGFSERIRTQAMINGTWLGELDDQKSTGEIYSVELEIEAIQNDHNEIIHYLGVFRDITEKVKVQQQLSKLATHDDLTELPNRTLLHELIVQSSLNSQRSLKSTTILLIDINNFKKINDTYGHNVGDEIICQTAQRLTETLYPKDVIARMNGADFCILVELSDPKYSAAVVARKILTCFDSVFTVAENQLSVTASIGITRFPEDAAEPQELLRKAALAILDIKAQNKNDYQFFEQRMNSEVAEQLTQERKLLTAIKNNEFEFYYQPIVNIKTGLISGAEALIRRVEDGGKIIYPDSFIPFAEKLGLIDRIDKIAIDKVFMQVALWQKQSINFGPISINLSAKTFADAQNLIPFLSKHLTRYQIPASLIKIEITEGMLLEDIDQAIATMEQLKALGFKLSLDDFGTGFSSLNYLKRFPIDILKIDRSFIMGMHKSPIDQSIVRSIIDLADNLNLSVIAEGVELEEHLEFLKSLSCQEYQGYHFSKAITVSQIEQMVAAQKQV